MRADSRSVTGKQELILLERKLVLGTAGWGIIWRNQVPPPENLLVKGRVMLAADSTCQPCASSDTYFILNIFLCGPVGGGNHGLVLLKEPNQISGISTPHNPVSFVGVARCRHVSVTSRFVVLP